MGAEAEEKAGFILFCLAFEIYRGKGKFWVIGFVENVSPVSTGTLEEQQHQFPEQRGCCHGTRRDYYRLLPTGFRYVLCFDLACKMKLLVEFGIHLRVTDCTWFLPITEQDVIKCNFFLQLLQDQAFFC